MQPPPTRGHLVLIGGSVRAATESAAQDGWEISAIDLFGDLDTRRSARSWHPLTSSGDLDRLLGQLPPGPLVVTGGMEQWYERLDSIRATRPVLAPASRAIERLRDPAYLGPLARASGFQFPPCSEPRSAGVPAGWLVKSRRSTAGLSVSTVLSGPPGADEYFQQRVPGRPFGAAFLATNSGAELLGVARSLTRSIGQHPFFYSGSIGPVPVGPANRHKLLRLGEAIRQQLNLRGLFGADLIADRADGTLWLLEINPRMTASMELFEAPDGPSLITRHVDAYGFPSVGSESTKLPTGSFSGDFTVRLKRVVWSRNAFRWDPEWQHAAVSGTLDVVLRDIPQPNSPIGRDQPVVSICAAGRSMRECLRAAVEVEKRLHRKIRAAR